MTSQDLWRRGCVVVGGLAALSLADVAMLTAQGREHGGGKVSPQSITGKRDPFLPPFLTTVPEVRVTPVPKTPLQRTEIESLKLVGVIWAINEPRALVEDNDGLGYIVTRGTLIGARGGMVKAIEAKRIVIEEQDVDPLGKRIVNEKELHLTGVGWSQDDKQ